MAGKWKFSPLLLGFGLLIKTTPVGPRGRRDYIITDTLKVSFPDDTGRTLSNFRGGKTKYGSGPTYRIPLSDLLSGDPSSERGHALAMRYLRCYEYGWVSQGKKDTPSEGNDILWYVTALRHGSGTEEPQQQQVSQFGAASSPPAWWLEMARVVEEGLPQVEAKMAPDYW